MGTLRLPGLLTGIDTNKLIAQLMAVQSRTLVMYQQRKEVWEQKGTALDTLEGKLSNLRRAAGNLSDSGELKAFNASTSDDEKVTASASNSAAEGNYTVVVNQLATAEQWVHTAGLEYAEDIVGTGTFIYSYNNKETSIATNDTTTLNDLVGLINNDANNPGVTATLLHYNDSYHLVLNGNGAGTDYQISVNASTTRVLKADTALTDNGNATLNTRIIDLDEFTPNLGLKTGEQIQIIGTDHFGNAITQVNLNVTSDTKVSHLISEINDAFDGIAKATLVNGIIVLTDKTAGTSDLTIGLAYNQGTGDTELTLPTVDVSSGTAGGTAGTLTNFAASDFTESQSAQDSQIRVGGFPLATSEAAEIQTLTPSDPAASGHYYLNYNGQTTGEIQWNDGIAAVQTAINNLSNVTAGDIVVGGDPLSEDPVVDGMTFTFLSTAGDVGMISIDDTALVGPGSFTMVETVKGSDGYINRSSNTVDDVITGVALHLHNTTDAAGEKITLTRDIDTVKDLLNSLVVAYNSTVNFIKETTGYNSTTETSGVLIGDGIVRNMQYQFREPLIRRAAGFVQDIDTFLTPLNIGLEIDRDGELSLDTNDFDEAIAENYADVLEIIGAKNIGGSSNESIGFYGATTDTTGGSYTVKVEYSGDALDAVWIKLSSEGDSAYREMTVTGNVAIGNSATNNGYPVYPEKGLQVTIPSSYSGSGEIAATVYVKQGFTGLIEDRVDNMLRATVGSLIIDQEYVEKQVKQLEENIVAEESRLEDREDVLIMKFALLEKALAALQGQGSILSMLMG